MKTHVIMKSPHLFPLVVSIASLLGVSTLSASVVFQADFNGSGSGTGGASDIVQYGGTGVLYSQSGSNAASSVSTALPLAPGSSGYLSIADTGKNTTNNLGGGVTFSPASAANSFDSWLTQDGAGTGRDSLVGAFDFFFRLDNKTGTWEPNSLRFMDFGDSSQGLRLVLNNNSVDRLQLELIGGGRVLTANNPGTSPIGFTSGTLYHLAGTVATNPANGHVTLSLYLAEGNTAIDTSTSTHRIGQATSTGSYDVTQAFNSANGFNFGYVNNSIADTKDIGLDSFRIYDAIPGVFSALPIPEPGAISAILFGGLIVLAVSRRRVGRASEV